MVTVRFILSSLGKGGRVKLLELNFPNSENQVLTLLCSGKETQVTCIYGKKVVDSANNGTEALNNQLSC